MFSFTSIFSKNDNIIVPAKKSDSDNELEFYDKPVLNKHTKIKIDDIQETKNTLETDEENNTDDDNTDDEENTDNESYDSDRVESDNFSDYIVTDSSISYAKNAIFCKFNWNGIIHLDRWELQRKVEETHVDELKELFETNFKKNGEFIFYDPIHIGKKKDDDKYYVLDGQHRISTVEYFVKSNKYAIQQIPAIIWYVNNEKEFIDLFHKINNRLSLDKLKLMQVKLLEIIQEFEKKYGKDIWKKNRPFINKEKFVEKLRETDSVHKLTTTEIMEKIYKINEKLRQLPRSKRVKNVKPNIHNSAEEMDFFLGMDKDMNWMKDI